MSKRTRKTFSPEFKREAVRLLESGDKESAQLARELGVRRNHKWQKEVHEYGARDRGQVLHCHIVVIVWIQ